MIGSVGGWVPMGSCREFLLDPQTHVYSFSLFYMNMRRNVGTHRYTEVGKCCLCIYGILLRISGFEFLWGGGTVGMIVKYNVNRNGNIQSYE